MGDGAGHARQVEPTDVFDSGDAGNEVPFSPNDAIDADNAGERREHFIPITRHALIDRLSRPNLWPAGQGDEARRFFRFLDFWRRQSYVAKILQMEQYYEPFSPDSDLLITRRFSPVERHALQKRFVAGMLDLLDGANYTVVDPADMQLLLTKDSHYGLDLQVDLKVFDELVICYRGATSRTETRRDRKKLYLKHEEFEVPIFQRLFILFKIKSVEARIPDIMEAEKCSREAAEKIIRKRREALPKEIKSDCIYMKLFKNMPRSDLEMCFPNTRIRFRMFDKVKLGLTGGGAMGMGIFGTAGKIAAGGLALSNPIALAGAVAGLGGVAIRQASNFANQKNRYMATMAQNLYFHAMADNRGVMAKLADRAAEEDVKEEMLLYAVLAKEPVHQRDLHEIDRAIESYLKNTFDIDVDFEMSEALRRLIDDGMVAIRPDGWLDCRPPADAALHIDAKWDAFLDNLPDVGGAEGIEFDEGDGVAAPA